MKQFSKLALSCILYMQTVTAATKTWSNLGTGDWNNAGNWSGGIPTATDIAEISNGGTAQLTTPPTGATLALVLANAPASSGTALIDNQSLTIGSGVQVGTIGAGHVIIQNGGILTGTLGILGGSPASSGTVVVDGSGSKWTSQTNDIGFLGPASLTIKNGGAVITANATITLNVSASGSNAMVTNPGSLWDINIANPFVIGANGNATLTISDGGEVRSGITLIALNANTSAVNATGPGSLWTITGILQVGVASNGALTVQDGAHVSTTGITTLATNGGSVGTLNLNGTAGRRGLLTVSQLQAGAGNASANFDGGILQARANNAGFITAFPLGKLNILGGGLFLDSQGFNIATTNALTGVGPLTKMGTGILTLSGTNTYGGDTTVSGGTLQINTTASLPTNTNVTLSASGATLDLSPAAGSFTIGDLSGVGGSQITLGSSNLTFGTSNSTIFAGTISGTGGITKQGSGTSIFTGASTYTGPTQINAGTFVINGSITSPTTVAAGATLKGTGTIAGSLTVNGTVRPGNSVGTLNVAGPVIFNSGSTYVEELNPAQASLLNITAGSATINPGVTLSILPTPGPYAVGSVYTIIQTATGVSGKFSTVTNSFPLLVFNVLYNPLNVQLLLEKISIESIVTGNAKGVAACLDKATPAAGSDLSNVISQILFVPSTETLQKDLNQMQPSQFNAFQLTQENVNTRIFSVLDTRMGQIHRACKPSDETWSIWADGFGDFQQQKHQHGEHGFHTATGAALFGFDGHASPHLHLGAGGAYTATHLKWGGAHGTGDISSGYGFAYGTWHVRHVFLDASFVGGYNNYDAKRHIGFLAVDRDAKSEHHGYTLAGRLLGGFPFKVWKTEVAPIISLDYDFVHQTSFKEHGAQSLNLHVHEKNANLLRAEAGFRVTRRCPPELKIDPCTRKESCVSDARFLPSLQLTVIREWRFQGQKTKARLQGVDCTFTSKGLNPDRTLISPAVGLTWLVYDDRVGVTLDYVGEFDVDGKYWDQKANLQISYAF